MRIGQITLNGNFNIGNRLQCYAAQIVCNQYGQTTNLVSEFTRERQDEGFKGQIKHVLKSILRHNQEKYKKIRECNFAKFEKKICSVSFDFVDSNDYDFYVVGSDQVWNLNFRETNPQKFMLGFAASSKKIAFSPSIGVTTINDKQEKIFKKYLSDFVALSCREQQGAELVNKATGRECLALIDPTLMLKPNEWEEVEVKPDFHDESTKYILLYFLGQITEEYKEIINRISADSGYRIINISNPKSVYYTCGPAEFIYMVRNAELVLTDSFHGSAFSYLFNRPFKIFMRTGGESMNSRLINLVNVLHIPNSVFINTNSNPSEFFTCNYDKSYLADEQAKFKAYLDNAFKR